MNALRWNALAVTAALAFALPACNEGDGGGGGSGGSDAVPSCDDVELDGFSVAVSLFKTGEDGSPGFAGTVTGQVTEIGDGPLGTQCFYIPEEASVDFVKVQDADGVSWTACGSFETTLLSVGDTVTIERDYNLGDGTPSSSELTLRRDGELLVVVVDRASANFTGQAPEIHVAAGELLCSREGGPHCDIQKFAAHVVAGDEEAGAPTAEIQPGGSAVVGDFEVHFGQLELYADNGGCESGSGALAYYAIRKTD